MSSRLERSVVASSGAVATVAGGTLIGLGSVVGPVLLVAGAVALIVAVLAFANLTFGILLVTILTFFEAIPTFGGDITFVKLAGGVVILSWLMLAANRRSGIRLLFVDHPLFAYTVVVFVTWAAASALWAPDGAAATSYAFRLVLVVALLFATYSAIREPRHVRLVAWAFVVGAFGTTMYGVIAGLGAKGRLVGGITNPNELAAAIVPALVLAAVLATTSRRPAARTAALVALATFVVALFMTSSRGALVGLGVGLVVALFVAGSLRPRLIALAVISVVVGLGYFALFAPSSERERFGNLSAQGSSGRTDEWQIALRVARDHPIMGIGLHNFQLVETQYLLDPINLYQPKSVLKRPEPHNLYLQILAELGIVGLLLQFGVIVGALTIGVRAIRRLAAAGDRETELLGRGLLVAVVSLLALYLFHNALLEKEFWLLTGLLVALTVLAERAESAASTEAETAEGPRPAPTLVRV